MRAKILFLGSYCYMAISLCTPASAQKTVEGGLARKASPQQVGPVKPASKSQIRTPAKEETGNKAVGETVEGPLSTRFQPEKEVWFVTNITRSIRTNDPILQSDLAERGFTSTPKGLTQDEVVGTKWTLQKGDFAQVNQGSPVKSEIIIANDLFSIRSTERSSLLVRENGGLLQQIFHPEVTRTEQVPTGNRVQTGWVQHPDLFGGIPAPIYSDEYVDRTVVVKPASRTDKEIETRIPRTPLVLPSNLGTGSVILFHLVGEPDVGVTWTVSRIYKLNGIACADGRLTNTDPGISVSGQMTLAAETGIIQHLEAKVQYERVNDLIKSVVPWTWDLSVDQVTQAQYERAKQIEWERYSSVGSKSAQWSKQIALSRLVDTERTIEKSSWQVTLLEGQQFTAKSGDDELQGMWEISNRQLGLTLNGTRWTRLFDFSLSSNTIKPADVDSKNIAELPQAAPKSDEATIWGIIGEKVELGKYHVKFADKPATLTLETGEQEGSYSGTLDFGDHLDTVNGCENDRDFIGASHGPNQRLCFLYVTSEKGALTADLVPIDPQGNWEQSHQLLRNGNSRIEAPKLDKEITSSSRSLFGTFKNIAIDDSGASKLILAEEAGGKVTGSLDFGEVSKTHLRLSGSQAQDGSILGIGEGNEGEGTTFFHVVTYKNNLFFDFITAIPDGDNFLISDKTRFVYVLK